MKTVSILMGIYNCAGTLSEAIDSLLSQTYSDWKLIMCDDGSADNTYDVAHAYKERYPDKIILIRNSRNMGLNYTLNRCLEYADTPYCARMDGDDISLPARLEKQMEFLEAHPEYAFVSTDMEYFDESGVWGKSHAKARPEKADFAKSSPFCHAPCLIRTTAYRDVGGYTESSRLLRMEDYHLWIKLYEKGYVGANITEALYRMRDDRNATKRRKYRYRINEAYVRYLAVRRLGLPTSNYVYALRPLAVGLIPAPLYEILHKKRLKKREDK